MNWALKRQIIIVSIVLSVLGIIGTIILYPKLNPPPTCTDGKQNGKEQGVDCGGSCTRICPFATNDVVVKWARAFPVTDEVWNAVAYIENPNVTAAARQVPYEFRFYDDKLTFIVRREGVAYIAPNGTSAIFEGGINVGSRPPQYTEFKFLADPVWESIDPRNTDIKIFPKDQKLENADTRPRFQATVTNTSQLFAVQDIDLIAIMYGADGNALAVSQTSLEGLAQTESANVYFTWQKPFTAPVTRTEILPRFNVFLTNFSKRL
jgi:hypothetical protein